MVSANHFGGGAPAGLYMGGGNDNTIGQMVNAPTIPGIDYVSMTPSYGWMIGRNIGLARAYIQKLNMMKTKIVNYWQDQFLKS